MYAYVLPFEVILFQLVVLAVVIAIEAEVFYNRFILTRRQSLEYSILLNVFSSVANWILFFILQGLLPDRARLELISYIFFDHFYQWKNVISIPSVLMIVGIFDFVAICIIEFYGTFILQKLAPSIAPVSNLKIPEYRVKQNAKKGRNGKKESPSLMTALVMSDPHKIISIITANTFSSGAIFLFFCLLGILK